MHHNLIRIGTRGSKLALWQAYHVEKLLQQAGCATEIVIIQTKGDLILDKTLSKIGSKGIFTEELENALRTGSVDIAVHSAKDVQSTLPDDLELIAFMEREEVNDVLVSSNKNLDIRDVAKPFVIGTSSTRRTAFLKHFFPHIKIVDMRGNLQTRLQKLADGHCDALLLAYAGVHRMGYDDKIIEKLSTEIFVPPVGQGSVAIETARSLAVDKQKLITKTLNHDSTAICLKAERAYLATLHGGCSIPSFAMATLKGDVLSIEAGLVSLDGKTMIRHNVKGAAENAELLGIEVAEKVLDDGGEVLLKEIRKTLNQNN